MTVYADVLLCTDFIIDYFIISFTALLMKSPVDFKRQLFASGFASLTSLVILIPDSFSFIAFVIRISAVPLIVFISFGKSPKKVFFKRIFTFLTTAFVFCGFMEALLKYLKPRGLKIHNGIVYYDISSLLLIGLSAVIYTVLTLLSKYFAKKTVRMKNVSVVTDFGKLSIDCIVDSGNKLREPFSDTPVLLIDKSYQKAVDPGGLPQRVIPYSTVSGEGLLMGFRPKSVYLSDSPSEKLNLYIAFGDVPGDVEFSGILPEDAL